MVGEIIVGFLSALMIYGGVYAVVQLVKRRKGRYKDVFRKIIEEDYKIHDLGYDRDLVRRNIITDQQRENFTARDLDRLEKLYIKMFQDFIKSFRKEQHVQETFSAINEERRTRTEVTKSLNAPGEK